MFDEEEGGSEENGPDGASPESGDTDSSQETSKSKSEAGSNVENPSTGPDVAKEIKEVQNIGRVLDLKMVVTVNIGTVKMTLKEVMNLVPGGIIEVQKNIEEPLALSVNNKKELGVGEVVTIGESLGLRLLEVKHS